jgi:hypothetical protein
MSIEQTHFLNCDILVAGGGPAGVPAALAAARQGAKVILCQDRPVLGGNASSEVRMHIVGANGGRPGKDLEVDARETGIIEEVRLDNAWRNVQGSPSMFDFLLYDKCRSEENLTVMLNTHVVDATVVDGRITEAVAIRPSTEDRFIIRAQTYIDCTGDGGLGAAAGAVYQMGREEKERYGESLAQDKADKKTLGSTLLLMGRKHDKPMPFVAPSWARKFTEEDLKLRDHAQPGVDTGLEYGFWWMEWGGELDTIKDNPRIHDELLAIVMGVWDHIKNSGDHGAEYWALDWFGAVPGKRESRRFIGQYVLNENDVMGSTKFEDAIAYGGWPIDTHPPEGVYGKDLPPCTQHRVPFLFDIPLRSCVARDIKNLMFAGRNISATHIAFASTRVMATCAVVGEGVGVSAVWGLKNGVQPIELAANRDAVRAIQQILLRNDSYLIGVPLDESDNLIAQAKLTASSEQPNGAVTNLLSGHNRSVHGERGAPPGRQVPGTHRWLSDPAKGIPAWVLAEWKTPQSIHEIQLVLDSGLHRHLTLSQSKAYFDSMYWGRGQPEMLRSFSVEALVDGAWKVLADVPEQWQRVWSWKSETPVKAQALRVQIRETWGCDHARLVRWAAY